MKNLIFLSLLALSLSVSASSRSCAVLDNLTDKVERDTKFIEESVEDIKQLTTEVDKASKNLGMTLEEAHALRDVLREEIYNDNVQLSNYSKLVSTFALGFSGLGIHSNRGSVKKYKMMLNAVDGSKSSARVDRKTFIKKLRESQSNIKLLKRVGITAAVALGISHAVDHLFLKGEGEKELEELNVKILSHSRSVANLIELESEIAMKMASVDSSIDAIEKLKENCNR